MTRAVINGAAAFGGAAAWVAVETGGPGWLVPTIFAVLAVVELAAGVAQR